MRFKKGDTVKLIERSHIEAYGDGTFKVLDVINTLNTGLVYVRTLHGVQAFWEYRFKLHKEEDDVRLLKKEEYLDEA